MPTKKAKPSKTMRGDLECKQCKTQFRGHIAEKWCPACREAKAEAEAAQKPGEAHDGTLEVGEAVEVVAAPEPAAEPVEVYEKKIHTDPTRTRYERQTRDQLEREAARRKAEAEEREDPAEKRRKVPLRQEFQELIEKQKRATAVIEECEERKQEIRLLLSPTECPDDPNAKKCYGQYDRGDHECMNLCRLRLECEAETGYRKKVLA